METSIPKVRLLSTHGDGPLDVYGIVRRWKLALGNGHSADAEVELRSLFRGLRTECEGEGSDVEAGALVGSDIQFSD